MGPIAEGRQHARVTCWIDVPSGTSLERLEDVVDEIDADVGDAFYDEDSDDYNVHSLDLVPGADAEELPGGMARFTAHLALAEGWGSNREAINSVIDEVSARLRGQFADRSDGRVPSIHVASYAVEVVQDPDCFACNHVPGTEYDE